MRADTGPGARKIAGVLIGVATVGWAWLLLVTLLRLAGMPVQRHHFESAGLAFGAGLLLLAIAALTSWPSKAVSRAASANSNVVVIPVVVGALAFYWTVALGPLSDDYVIADWARAGNFTPGTWPHVRPLPLWIWRAVDDLGGSWATLHAINVSVHAVNAGLVYLLTQRRLGVRGGVVAATLFALFPAAVEAVAWSAGVFDLTSTLFVLVALLCAPAAASSMRAAGTFLLASTCALLCKEIAVVIPALVVLDAVCSSHRRQRLRACALPAVSSVLLIVGYLLVRATSSPAVSAHLANMPTGRRQWKDLVVRPFAALALPLRTDQGLSIEHFAVALAALTLVGVSLLYVWRTQKTGHQEDSTQLVESLTFGASWVLVAALPLLVQFYVSPTMAGSRYAYLPTVGFVMALATAFSVSTNRSSSLVGWLAVITLLVSYALRIGGERSVWSTAAQIRDAVVLQATAQAQALGCGSLSIADAPDNYRGAYIFREGLAIALEPVNRESSIGPACRLRWDDETSRLVPQS